MVEEAGCGAGAGPLDDGEEDDDGEEENVGDWDNGGELGTAFRDRGAYFAPQEVV